MRRGAPPGLFARRRGSAPVAAALAALLFPLASAPAGGSGDDLAVVPGPDGFVSTWLALGPITAPRRFARVEGGLEERDPLGAAGVLDAPRLGERAAGASWRVISSPRTRASFDGARPATAYLAAVLRVREARRILLSTGSDGGLEVWLRGKRLISRAVERRARPDTDLVPLDLPAGESLLLLRAWRRAPGPWRVHARLMDEQHRRPRGIELVLPGAGARARKLVSQSASLSLDRTVRTGDRSVDLLAWLRYPGGRPVAGDLSAKVTFEGRGAPAPEEVRVGFGPDDPAEELLARRSLSEDGVPSSLRVDLPGGSLTARVGIRAGHLSEIANAAADLSSARETGRGLPRTSVESVAWRIGHLSDLVEAGDGDWRYLGRESRIAAAMARDLARGRDPYAGRRGEIQRRGYRSSVDGRLHPYALYVPPGWREEGSRRFGLVVALHGLRSYPVKALQTVFGLPMGEGETREHRDRHPEPVGAAPVFVLAPEGFGSSGYRAFGEVDVLEAMGRVAERYRIDPDRVWVTGASMGGIGAASLPLHHPDLFAAAAPLCGYHSLSVYRDLRGVSLRPWEEILASYRSNADWAANGRHVPMYVVHGTRDGPRHSAVLVEAYRSNGYDVTFETPDAGHDVWSETYAERRIFSRFAEYRRKAHPRRVTLHTARLRYGRSHWLRVDDARDHAAWTRVDATWDPKAGRVEVSSENASALTVLRDEELAASGPPAFVIDGDDVAAPPEEGGGWAFHEEGGSWAPGAAPRCEECKRPGLAGPMDDVFFGRLLFVYGTGDPDETALSRRIAMRLARPRAGVTVGWPVEADVEVSEGDIRDCSLVLVGTPAGNRLLARVADRLPIAVEDGAISAGGRRFEGETVAAAFVHPNPLNPDRYVLVHTGATARALFYAAHLPDLVPDWVIYDASSWGRAGGLVLGEREVLAAGFFDRRWRL